MTSPTPYQHAVLSVPERYNLLLAGGRGGGKTHAALLIVLRHIEKYGKDARPLLVRETYKAIEEVGDHLDALLTDAYGRGVQRNRGDGTIRCPNGAIIELGQIDGPQAAKKYQGRSFTLLVVDEAGLFRERRWIAMLRASLRAPDGIPLREIMCANPGGPQHAYLHKTYVSAAPAWHPFEVEGATWVHAPSTLRDNPHLDHEDYEKRLRAATGSDDALLRAWLTGDWNIARGAFFAGTLDERTHMLPSWPYPVTRQWGPTLGLDWGVAAPSVAFLGVRSPGVDQFPKGSVILIDEVHSANPTDLSEGLRWPPSKLAEAIKEMAGRWGVRNVNGVGDDAYGIDHNLLSVLASEGIYLDKPDKGRIAGWAAMRQMLTNTQERNGRPGLWISARCRGFWETVPFLPRDERRPEDVDTAAIDHWADAARYLVLANRNRVRSGRHRGMY